MSTTKRRDVTCPSCGYKRRVYSDADTVVCRACTSAAKRTGRMVECPGCGREHYVKPSDEEKGIRYCSMDCANAHRDEWKASHTEEWKQRLSRQRRGKANPNYRNGSRTEANRVAASHRRWNLALKGEESCRNCGAAAKHLHHIVPRSVTRRGLYDVERNGLPLCPPCHFGWHRRSLTITRDVLTEGELGFALGAAGEGWLDLWYPE